MEFELKANSAGVTAKFIVEATPNESDNTSTLTIQMFLKSSSWITTYFLDGSITSGDNTITFDPTDDNCYGYIGALNSYNQVKQSPFTLTVLHNPDGTGPAMLDINIKGTTRTGGAGSGWRITGTLDVPLTTIPRASEITSTADVIFGGLCSVRWTPAAATFRYKLKFELENWSYTTDYITPNTTESFVYSGYTIPYEAAEQLPNDSLGSMMVSLYTYSGEDLIGEDFAYMLAAVLEDANTKPEVSILSVAPVTALDSPLDQLFIQGKSKASVVFNGTGKLGAAISSYSVTIGTLTQEATSPFTTDFINDYGEVKVTITATDSRGFTSSATQLIDVLGYTKPRLTPIDGENAVVCARCNGDEEIADDGTSLMIQAKKVYSSLSKNNKCRLLLQWKLATAPDSAYSDSVEISKEDTDTYSGVFDSVVFDKTARYSVRLIAEDLLDSTSLIFTIMSDKIYWHRGEDFLALGMYRENGGFECAWPARFLGDVYLGDVYIGDMTLDDYIKSLI